MRTVTSQYFRIGISTTKTLFKIKNLNTDLEIKINVKNIISGYDIKENILLNSTIVLNRTLYLLDKNLNDLGPKVKNNKKQFNALKQLQINAKQLENEFFKNNYSYRCLFKQCLNLQQVQKTLVLTNFKIIYI